MWPLPPLIDEHVTIIINPTHLICAWISESKKQPMILKAYQSSLLDTSSVNTIAEHVNQFLMRNNLKNSFLHVALASPIVHEELLRLSKASPRPSDFNNPELKKLLWDYRYLHLLDDGHHLFYLTGISRAALFAYQLLAHKSNLTLTSITSSYMALLQSYRQLFGPAFRQSQLGIDLIKTDYQLEKSMSTDSIMRMMSIKPTVTIDVEKQKLPLLTMIGLYQQERQ